MIYDTNIKRHIKLDADLPVSARTCMHMINIFFKDKTKSDGIFKQILKYIKGMMPGTV